MKTALLVFLQFIVANSAFGIDHTGVGSTTISENGTSVYESTPERCVARIDEEKGELSLLTSPPLARPIPRKVDVNEAAVTEGKNRITFQAPVAYDCNGGRFGIHKYLGGRITVTVDTSKEKARYTMLTEIQCMQTDIIYNITMKRNCDLNF